MEDGAVLHEKTPQEALTAAKLLEKCFITGGKLLLCGNGGSAADASHLAGELIKSFERVRAIDPSLADEFVHTAGDVGAKLAAKLQRGLPAISLSADSVVMSAISNDIGSDSVFAQQVASLGNPEDVLFCISTSGKSENVVNAAIAGQAVGMTVIGLVGPKGSSLEQYCDHTICVGDMPTAEVQQEHQRIYHEICRLLEKRRL